MSALDDVRKLYEELPTVACKGLCWNSCGPIDMSDAERERIVELGVDIPTFTQERSAAWAAGGKGDLYCPALSFGAHEGGMGCTIYEDRPLVCRAWGSGTEDLACPYGCETSDTLSNGELTRLLIKSFRIGGHGKDDVSDAEELLAELADDPTYQALMTRWMSGDRSVEPALKRLIDSRRR